ncbi:hypothetical protein ACH4GK_34595 [Streptomyces rimosus]|uniref:hypothetical protein n=1 Tax=Streptomyces rimosus TaxID=1927 RepID=UPI001F1D2E4E|nr:hypothetical protein [Streptomyces rimosus]
MIDTDGFIQRIDSLKTAYAGAPDLEMDILVYRADLEHLIRHIGDRLQHAVCKERAHSE